MLLSFFFYILNASAQEEIKKDTTAQNSKGVLVNLTDGIAARASHGAENRKGCKEFNAVDTTFISPNLYNLAFMLEHSSWYEYYRLGSNSNNGEQSISFSPNANFKLGVYFGWRWIFLGYSFDVKDIFGGHKNKAKKTEMALNLYSSKFGVDLYWRKTGSDFKIRSYNGFQLNTPTKNMDFNGFQSKIKGLNAYWIFNYKRFSYPAAYSQSTNQRKPALKWQDSLTHSIIFLLIMINYQAEMRDQLHNALLFKKVKYSDYSLCLGYGYNWVFARTGYPIFHSFPAIAYKKSKINDTPQPHTHWIKDINFDLITRASIVYNNSKYFAGAALVMHTYDYRKEDFSLTNTFGTLVYMSDSTSGKRKNTVINNDTLIILF